jgi:twinkle protein
MMEALERRALDVELMALLGVWSERGKSAEAGDTIVMPYFREKALVHRKYRNFAHRNYDGMRHWQDKGGVKCFYNEDVLRDPDLKGLPLIITEGEGDTWAVLTAALTHEVAPQYHDEKAVPANLRKCVSVPDGAPQVRIMDPNSPKYSYVDDALDAKLLFQVDVPYIILATDGDEPGTNLMYDLADRLGRARCKYLTYPLCSEEGREKRERDRCKDLGEVLEDWGPEGVRDTIAKAQFLKVDGVFRMSELPPRPVPTILDIGMPILRDHIKIRLGDWSCSTGIPSMGKTTLFNAIVVNLVKRYGIVVAFASFEQNPQLDHRRNLRTAYHRKPVFQQTNAEIAEADAWIDKHFVFLVPDDDDDVTMDWMLDKMETAAIQFNAVLFVIDPWNEMDHARERDETTTEYTGRAIKMKRRFARKFGVHVHTVAHPTKMARKEGEPRVPNLYSIADSSHWYNKADLGWIVHRKDELTYVWVQKSRYHDEIGVPGAVSAYFNPGTREFDIVENLYDGNLHLDDYFNG